MTDIEIIPASEYQCMPWKNGLGSTLEIKRFEDANGQRFRISKASVVEDGLFSDFTGQQRTLVLLSGEGMTLQHKGHKGDSSHILKNSLDIARFSGADASYATLENNVPIEDLNIMVREKDTLAKVVAIKADQSLTPTKSAPILLSAFYANDNCMVTLSNNEKEEDFINLPIGDFLYFKNPLSLLDKKITIAKGSGVFIEILDGGDTL